MGQIDISQVALEVVRVFVSSVSTTGISSERFDAGFGSTWFVCPQVSDAGDELRSKVIKAARVTGKLTNPTFSIYGYDVSALINTNDLEDGVNSSTGDIVLPSSTQVAQSPRQQVNVPNAVLSTIRVAGDCTGEDVMDRIDEIVYEVAEQGVRR